MERRLPGLASEFAAFAASICGQSWICRLRRQRLSAGAGEMATRNGFVDRGRFGWPMQLAQGGGVEGVQNLGRFRVKEGNSVANFEVKIFQGLFGCHGEQTLDAIS